MYVHLSLFYYDSLDYVVPSFPTILVLMCMGTVTYHQVSETSDYCSNVVFF